MTTPLYICETCGAAGDIHAGTPLPPDHVCQADDLGLTPARRFEALRRYFLEKLHAAGNGRAALYTEKRESAYGFLSEEDLVWHWARQLAAPLLLLQDGVSRAFIYAHEKCLPVTSFKFCMPHIVQRLQRKGPPL